ncbi:MAG: SDR family NAD(P)-dependent oxidoreductase, partial [Streptococcus gallolyticus]
MMTKPLALVTGGNAGIGFEISQILVVNGYNLVIAGIGDVETAKKELEKLCSRVTAVRCNLITAEG